MDKVKEEMDQLIESDVDIPFVKIPLSVIPDELLVQAEVEALFDIIDDES